jgi:hypothetical protein
VLQWLCFAKRDIGLNEIVDALAVVFADRPVFNPDERYPDPRDIFTRCSSLISLTITDKIRNKETLRLAHFSVKEYLISDRIRNGQAHVYAVIERYADEVIAKTCLAYLLQFRNVDPPDGSTIMDYPLAEYAGCYWLHHVPHQGHAIADDLQALILELFEISETQLVGCIVLEDVKAYS